jgi:hypothetical protein
MGGVIVNGAWVISNEAAVMIHGAVVIIHRNYVTLAGNAFDGFRQGDIPVS